MAKTTIICHLGNIAYRTGKTITWDPKKQDVAGASLADARRCPSYERPYRAPWKLKKYA
jgi:hypothetical protein